MTPDHGLCYVDRTGGELIRLDTDEPIDLPGPRRQVLADALDRASSIVARPTSEWPPRDNLAEAKFHPDRELPTGVFYVTERPNRWSPCVLTIVSDGNLFPWDVQEDRERQAAMSLLKFARAKLAS